MSNTAISVTTSATLLAAQNSARIRLEIENSSGGVVYLGDSSSVTTANGFTMADGEVYTFKPEADKSQFLYRGNVYAIAGSSLTVRVWEITTQRG